MDPQSTVTISLDDGPDWATTLAPFVGKNVELTFEGGDTVDVRIDDVLPVGPDGIEVVNCQHINGDGVGVGGPHEYPILKIERIHLY